MNLRLPVLAAILAIAAPSAAHAQVSDGNAADQARGQAQALNKEGVAFLAKKDFSAALDRFQRAYAVFPSPKVLINIAASLKELGRHAEAANAYQRYLDDPGAESARRAEVTKILATLDKQLGVVAITTDPFDSEVQVAGWSPGWIPPGADSWLPAPQVTRWRVVPGPFTVRARRAGHVDGQEIGSVNAGQRATVKVTLAIEEKKPDPVAPPPDVAALPHGGPDDGVDEELPAETAPPAAVRVGALVDVAIDGKGQGAAISPGISLRLIDRFEIAAKALVSGSTGAYLGASVYLTRGRFRPLLGAGVPVFFSNGTRLGVRGAAGLSAELADRLSAVVEVGGEYFFNPEMDRYDLVLVPLLGIHARL